jgi:hypothetical protein
MIKLRASLNLGSLPVFAIGASSGGSFVGILALRFDFITAVSSQIMSFDVAGLVESKIKGMAAPWIEFVSMPRDRYTEEDVRGNVISLMNIKVNVQKRECRPLPITPSFLSERTRAGRFPVSESYSGEIAVALRHAGFTDASGYLLHDPRGSDWRLVLERSSPHITGIEDMAMGPDESALSEALNVAYAFHEFCATSIEETFAFFEKAAAARKLLG